MHGAGAVRFDTKAEGNPAGEDPERIYNYVRLVRDAEPAAEPEYTIYLPLVTNGEAGDGAGDTSGYNLLAPLLDYSGLPSISQ